MPMGAPINATHLLNGKLDADGEHQQNDANLGHDFESVNVMDARARRERAEKETSEDIAQDERLADAPEQEAGNQG